MQSYQLSAHVNLFCSKYKNSCRNLLTIKWYTLQSSQISLKICGTFKHYNLFHPPLDVMHIVTKFRLWFKLNFIMLDTKLRHYIFFIIILKEEMSTYDGVATT